MCDCSERIDQLAGMVSDMRKDVTELVEFSREFTRQAEMLKSAFSEENIMGMLGGFLGGGLPMGDIKL